MKTRHNKKRNTVFLFEALIRELTKSVVERDSEGMGCVRDILSKHFKKGSILSKELDCYRSLVEKDHLDRYTAEKLIFQTKREHEGLDKENIFQEQTNVIKKINSELGKGVYNNFVPNYKDYASIAQIFGDKMPIKDRVLLEGQLIENLTGGRENTEPLTPVNSLVVQSFTERFNKEYKDLLPEQKLLLGKYVAAIGPNEADFKVHLHEELIRIRVSVANSVQLPEVVNDPDMMESTHKVMEQLESFNVVHVGETELLRILKLQKLVREYSTDDD
jgi:hypothetical protein